MTTAREGGQQNREELSRQIQRQNRMLREGLSYVPAVGPGIEAYEDLRDGKYLEAAGNAALVGVDLALIGSGVGAGAAVQRNLAWQLAKKTGPRVTRMTSNAMIAALRKQGVAKPGQQVHHSIRLYGKDRGAVDWRNHQALLKPLGAENHQRVHGNHPTLPKYDPVRRVWIGTPTWMKTTTAAVVGHGAQVGHQARAADAAERYPTKGGGAASGR